MYEAILIIQLNQTYASYGDEKAVSYACEVLACVFNRCLWSSNHSNVGVSLLAMLRRRGQSNFSGAGMEVKGHRESNSLVVIRRPNRACDMAKGFRESYCRWIKVCSHLVVSIGFGSRSEGDTCILCGNGLTGKD